MEFSNTPIINIPEGRAIKITVGGVDLWYGALLTPGNVVLSSNMVTWDPVPLADTYKFIVDEGTASELVLGTYSTRSSASSQSDTTLVVS